MQLKTRLFGKTFELKSVKEVLAKASKEKSGDIVMKIAATSSKKRISDLTLEDLRKTPIIPYKEDEATRVIDDQINTSSIRKSKTDPVGYLRKYILSHDTFCNKIMRIPRGFVSETVSAVAKLMRNMDLVYGTRKVRVITKANTEIGQDGTFAFRNQPNHPTDDIEGIMASAMEGLS